MIIYNQNVIFKQLYSRVVLLVREYNSNDTEPKTLCLFPRKSLYYFLNRWTFSKALTELMVYTDSVTDSPTGSPTLTLGNGQLASNRV